VKKYDLCIIGGGPSGYAAAMRALDFNKNVALVEAKSLGGAGLHNGALSSKTFWEVARQVESSRLQAQRYKLDMPPVPFTEVVQEVANAVNSRTDQLQRHLDLLNQLEDSGKVDLIRGWGRLESENRVSVHSKNGKPPLEIEADHIILACGSRPRTLPDIPIDESIILTSDGISNLTDYPKSLVILGAGVIGCEFATIFAQLGNTEVYLIDKGGRILPFEDEDIVHVVERNLERRGVHIHRHSRLESMQIKEGEVEYVLRHEDGHEETFRVEKALVSVGRVPNIEKAGIREIGIELSNRGHIVDKDTCTNIPSILAVGDLTADIALVNVGELEGRHAVEKIYNNKPSDVCYDNISTIMFLCPEVAGVGMNEIQAREKGVCYRVANLDYNCIPRAIAMGQTEGFFKILVSDDEEMRILGMRAVGEHASSAIQAVALLISMGKGIRELAEMVHPHPSITEGVQECIRMLLGKSILKPSVFKSDLKCACWREGSYHKLQN